MASIVLIAEPGTFIITGGDALLLHHRKLSAEAGALSINGQAATLQHTYHLSAEPGTFTITGAPASLLHRRKLIAEGSSAFVVVARDMVRKVAPGTMSIAPSTSGGMYRRRKIFAESATMELVGKDATLYRRIVIPLGRTCVVSAESRTVSVAYEPRLAYVASN